MYLQKIISKKRKILFKCQSPGNFSCNQNCLPELLRRRTNRPQVYGLIRRLGVYSSQVMMAEASWLINTVAQAVNVVDLAIWFLPPVRSHFSSPFSSPVLLVPSSSSCAPPPILLPASSFCDYFNIVQVHAAESHCWRVEVFL